MADRCRIISTKADFEFTDTKAMKVLCPDPSIVTVSVGEYSRDCRITRMVDNGDGTLTVDLEAVD